MGPAGLSLQWNHVSSLIPFLAAGAGNTPAALIPAFCWLIQTSKLPGKSKVLPPWTKSLPPHYCTVIPWDATMSKNLIWGFSLGDERVSSNSPRVPSPPGRHWITLNRILHGMKGEKDVKPQWFSVMKAHAGKWWTWKHEGREREIIREKGFMILITKIHNPSRLLFWLIRTFPLRDNNQEKKKKKKMQKQKERGEIIEKDWGKQSLPLACSLQQNKLHKLVTNPHSIRKHLGSTFHSAADPLLPNLLQIPRALQELP